MPEWSIWSAAAIVFFIVELFTTSAIFLCFGVSALLVAAVTLLGGGLQIQLFIFAVASVILFFLLKPLVVKYLYSSRERLETNVYALIGKTGIVIERIAPDENKGRVKVGGDDWRAVSAEDKVFEVGEKVIVVRVESNVVYVQSQKMKE